VLVRVAVAAAAVNAVGDWQLKAVRRRRLVNRLRAMTSHAPGWNRPAKSMVFAGLYPTNGEDYPLLREALDTAIRYKTEAIEMETVFFSMGAGLERQETAVSRAYDAIIRELKSVLAPHPPQPTPIINPSNTAIRTMFGIDVLA